MCYEFLHNLLSDKTDGTLFNCFSAWHFIWILLVFGGTILTILLLKNKSERARKMAPEIAVSMAFALYMADFFLMPFAYGEIVIDKLPFHACTTMCVLSFASRHFKVLSKYKLQFALIGLISNIIYIAYPDGVVGFEPISYRVIQTLLFHGLMTAYGILTLTLDDVKLEWKKCYRELAVLVILAIWALLGNTFYSATLGEYSHNFNWFFVKRDPLGIIPEDISKTIMPFITVTSFFAMDMIIYAIYFGIKKLSNKEK